jgi:cysteinyl-tRNA synthetase
VSVFQAYGKLSGKKIDELEAGARVEVMGEKKNPLDFALWKKSKEGEPFWESDWGKGRPGWHIECSAMSCKHLGETFDIHAGGNDLIFPHHENEIAQSEVSNKKKFVKYWIHFGFLNINKEKMSKSLGNFFTAREVLAKYSAEAIRLFFAQAHYRGPVEFTDQLLDGAETGLEKLKNLSDVIETEVKKNKQGGIDPAFDFKKYEDQFISALDDDFNTPQAVAAIFDFVKEANRTIASTENLNVDFYKKIKEFLNRTAGDILGIINFDKENVMPDSLLENKLIQLLIDIRLKAKKEKNFQLSDEIRKRLDELGITLKDTKEGTDFIKRS